MEGYHSIANDTFGWGEVIAPSFPTLTSAFYYQAETVPSAIAVRDLSSSPRELTYRELARHSQRLASELRDRGVKPDQRVPLMVKRGTEMVVGIWATLSCGAQYVPLDGGVVPDSTVRHVVEQSQGHVVLCVRATEARVRTLCPDATPIVIEDFITNERTKPARPVLDLARPESGCYVIYTSGTTGKPKGVDVTHKNVSNLVCSSPGNLGVRPGMNVGSVLNISFDMAAWEILTCLCNGGTLVLRGSDWNQTLLELDVLICTPTVLSKYHPAQLPRIKVVATAGEPTSQTLADLWASHGTYWNCCGPTETTIVNTMHKHVAGEGVSIGKPTPNNNVYILDEFRRPVAPGSPGIMWAGGHGVSRGYVALECKTNEVYIPDPFVQDGSCMYKTGDLGQWRPDGNIEILGRVDDQVKVKGFRVELDGVSASLASAPGIIRATVLLIDEQLHGFACPALPNVELILDHVRKLQPYYAVPSKVHLFELSDFPMTANGKIDKRALQASVRRCSSTASSVTSGSEKSTIVESTRSVSSSSTLTVASLPQEQENEKISEVLASEFDLEKGLDLSREVPEKRIKQPFRGLRKRILIVYRVIFSLISLINIGALLALIFTDHATAEWLATLTAANLTCAVLVRQDTVINILYTLSCSLPKTFPLWIRARCAKIYHLGGLHSGAGFCASAWLIASTVQSTIQKVTDKESTVSLATLVISWMICALCCMLMAFAYPTFRKRNHNLFERLHRFMGWLTLAMFWVRTVLSTRDATPSDGDLGIALVKTPGFWLLGIATLSIASSWLFLRKVPVEAVPLSDHAIKLTFDYTVPVNGSFTRLSHKPLMEWHSFATIPIPEPSPAGIGGRPGYSLVVSNAGDWTKSCIKNPPKELWVRGVPTCGVMRIATLFNRVVVIATGSGIGPLLGHISQPSCPTQLIWSTKDPVKTFGQEMIDTIRGTIPNAVIHDTRTQGRPDLVKMGYNMAKDFNAEAVIIIANEKITKKVVYGLETRGVAAYGAIWDS